MESKTVEEYALPEFFTARPGEYTLASVSAPCVPWVRWSDGWAPLRTWVKREQSWSA